MCYFSNIFIANMSVRYEIISGLKANKDFNGDGKIDEKDNVVVKYINNVAVEHILLTRKNEKELVKLLQSNPKPVVAKSHLAKAPVAPQQQAPQVQQRIIYQRSPGRNPPPLVVQQDTSLATNAKIGLGLGAGAAVGNMAVEGAVGFLGDLFE